MFGKDYILVALAFIPRLKVFLKLYYIIVFAQRDELVFVLFNIYAELSRSTYNTCKENLQDCKSRLFGDKSRWN